MEGQLWRAIVAVLARLDKLRKRATQEFSDEEIVKIYYWSVIHDRPVSWACQRCNCPWQRWRGEFPSNSTMSRRLRTPSVRRLLDALQERITHPAKPGMFWVIDGKPLVISNCSKDRQAGYGPAVSGMAKGYKIHLVIGGDGSLAAWRVSPMNTNEKTMAARLLRSIRLPGYIVADSAYDANRLHRICDERKNQQLVAPRRKSPGKSFGHHKHSPGRRRSVHLLEDSLSCFGQQLLKDRNAIERFNGNLVNWGGGLTHLPPWTRTHRRVRRWVQAKLALNALRRALKQST